LYAGFFNGGRVTGSIGKSGLFYSIDGFFSRAFGLRIFWLA
jgi:hypothetical protein